MSPEALAALMVALAAQVLFLWVICEVVAWKYGRQATGRVHGLVSEASSAPSWYLAYLIDAGPPARLGRIAVRRLPFRVGRNPGLSLVLRSVSVSREHAELFEGSGALHVRDLNSKNGTYVNGCRVLEARLSGGDIVHFADMEFRLEGPQVDRDSAASRGRLAAESAPIVPVVWHGEVVGRLHGAVVERRTLDSRYEERRARGGFVSNAGPVSEEFWRLVQLTDASPTVNEAPFTESFFLCDLCGGRSWLVTVAPAGSNVGSMAELSLLVQQARTRLSEERDREEAEHAREYVMRSLEAAPPWALPLVVLAPPTDSWRKVWAYSAEHADYTVSLLLGGVTFACRLVSVNRSCACVLTRAPIAGGELGILRAFVPVGPIVISAKVAVQGIGERFLSGLGKRFIRKFFGGVTGPRCDPILAILRLTDSDLDPEWVPRPAQAEKAADTRPAPPGPQPITLLPGY